jgi:hypothetical protein
MTRARRASRSPSSLPAAAPATLDDAAAIVRITDAGVKAIIAAAAEHGLDGPPWDPDVLHERIMQVVAHSLRQSTEWWAGRTGADGQEEADGAGE